MQCFLGFAHMQWRAYAGGPWIELAARQVAVRLSQAKAGARIVFHPVLWLHPWGQSQTRWSSAWVRSSLRRQRTNRRTARADAQPADPLDRPIAMPLELLRLHQAKYFPVIAALAYAEP